MTALPQHQTFAECLPANGTNIAACNAAYTPELQQATATAKDLSRQAGAGFMSAASVFCLGDTCPAFINDFPVTLDGTHFTSVAMQSAAPFVAIAIRDAAS